MQEFTDEELILQYLKGDESSLNFLIERYLKQIYGFIFKYVKDQQIAEDIAQDVFLKVWKNLKKFDENRKFKPWLYTIAKNTTLDYIKKKKPINFSSYENKDGKNILLETIKSDQTLPIEFAENQLLKSKLSETIKKLPEKYRSIFSLHYKNDFNLKEIANVLKQPLNTIKTRYRRGLVMLKKIIQGNKKI